jgi:DNA-binding transcriptional ArsR family regulator
MPDALRITSPEMLRALSHPMRQEILAVLIEAEHARATDIAKLLGEPANAVSHHLRVLAKAGLIGEAPEEARDKRDRVWRKLYDAFELDTKMAGADAFTGPMLEWARAMMTEDRSVVPDDPRATRTVSQLTARLTKQEALEMADELNKVVKKWSRRALDDTAHNDERVQHLALLLVGNRSVTARDKASETREPRDSPASDSA